MPVDIPLIAGNPQGDGVVDYFTGDVVSYSDYLAFGQVMPNRHGDDNQYRYGYQGSERDDELKHDGESYVTHYRMLDPRLGRWFSMDPVFQPWHSPYVSMNNNPIWHNDIFGDKVAFRDKKANDGYDKAKGKVEAKISEFDKLIEAENEKLKIPNGGKELSERKKQKIKDNISALERQKKDWSSMLNDFIMMEESDVIFEFTSNVKDLPKNKLGQTSFKDIKKDEKGNFTGNVLIQVTEGRDDLIIHESKHGNEIFLPKVLTVLEAEKAAWKVHQLYDPVSVKEMIDKCAKEDGYHMMKSESTRPEYTLENMINFVYKKEIESDKTK